MIGAASDIFSTLPVAVKPVTSADGYIYDDATKQVLPASIQLLVTDTGLPYNGDVPLYLSNGNYSAWTDGDPNDIAAKFTAPGYTPVVTTIAILSQSPDIYMNKATGSSLTVPLLLGAGLLLFMNDSPKKRKKRVGANTEGAGITTGNIVTIGVGILVVILVSKLAKPIADLGQLVADAAGLPGRFIDYMNNDQDTAIGAEMYKTFYAWVSTHNYSDTITYDDSGTTVLDAIQKNPYFSLAQKTALIGVWMTPK